MLKNRLIANARTMAFAAVLLIMAACAAHRTTEQQPEQQAVKQAPVEKPPAIRVLDANSEEQDKARIKQTLGKNYRGTLAPADVGYYLDVLQGRLQQGVNSGMLIDRQGDRMILDLTHEVDFPSGDAQINVASCDNLATLSKILVEYQMTFISVKVSVDDSSAKAAKLAGQRARALAHCLLKLGVPSERIVIVATPITMPPTANDEQQPHVELDLEPILREKK